MVMDLQWCRQFPMYFHPIEVPAFNEVDEDKFFEVLCPLHLDGVYACVFSEEEYGEEILHADSLTDGMVARLCLDDVPDDARVQILGLQMPGDLVVAEYEGIAADLKTADRVQLELVSSRETLRAYSSMSS